MSASINRSWTLSAFGLRHLAITDGPVPEPAPHELLVKVRAVSLNYKDKLIVEGMLMPNLLFPHIPASDAVGEVIAIGAGVSRFKPGDRVLGQVIADWIDGDAPSVLHQHTLGMTLPGVLADYILLDEQATVAAPSGLSDAEAATQSDMLRTRLTEIFAEWRSPFAACIAEGQAANEIATTFAAEELAEFLLSSWEGAILRMKVERSAEPLERFKRIAFATVLKEPPQ
jgi:hypothetical protein